MGPGQPLADLFVQFTTKGQEALSKAFETLQSQLVQLERGIDTLGKTAEKTFDDLAKKIMGPIVKSVDAALGKLTISLEEFRTGLRKSFEDAGQAIKTAMLLAAGSVSGFVTAGFRASAIGEVFAFQMERLTRSIAGLFRPELEKVIDLVTRLTSWLQSLSEQQRANIAHWIEGAAVALGVAVILPRVVAGVQAVVGAVRALSAAITAGLTATGIGALLPLLSAAVSLFAGLAVGTEAGRSALAGLWQALRPVADAFRQLWAALQPAFDALARTAVTLVKALTPVLAAVMRIVAAVAGALAPVFAALASALEPALKVLGMLLGLLTPILEAVANLVGAVGELGGALAEVLGGLLGSLFGLLGSLLELLKPILDFIIGVVKFVLDAISSAIKALAGAIRSAVAAVKELFGVKPPPPEEEKKPGRRGELERRLGGFESVESVYNRLALAAVRGTAGKKPEEATAENTERTARAAERTAVAVERMRPAVV